MKILGNTPEGDLIIQVSQAEWDGLQDGVRPKDDWLAKWESWPYTPAGKLMGKHCYGINAIRNAFRRGEIDGSIQSLRDIVDNKVVVPYVGLNVRSRLKNLLDEQPNA